MIGGGGGPALLGLQQQPSFSNVLKRCTKSNRSTTKKEEVASPPRIPSVISVPFHLDKASTATNDDPHDDPAPPSYQEAVNAMRSSTIPQIGENFQRSSIHECGISRRASDTSASQKTLSYGFLDDDEGEQGAPNHSARNYQREPKAANRRSSHGWSIASSEQSPLIHKDCLLASVRSMASSEAVHEELQRILALPVGRGQNRPPPPHPKEPAKPVGLYSKDLFQATPLYPAFPRPPVAVDGPPQNDGWKGARAG